MDCSRLRRNPSRCTEAASDGAPRSAEATSEGAPRSAYDTTKGATASVEDTAKGAAISAEDTTEKQCIKQFIFTGATATVVARTAGEEQQFDIATAHLPSKLSTYA